MPLLFRIQPSRPEPAYRQVIKGVTEALTRGELQPGERLPSIRTLARQLAINPNTVARAYRELEHLGRITSRQGSGFEVRGGPAADETVRTKLTEAIEEAVAALGPKAALQLARELITTAEKQTEGNHDHQS